MELDRPGQPAIRVEAHVSQIKGLPPGEYLAVAQDYVEDEAWNDPEYLESLRHSAQKVVLAEGASQTVALKLLSPKG